ncbi:MAG: tetratricopeptide repeat protein [Limisphaerales bacterium]
MIRQQSTQKVPVNAGRREQRWRTPAVCLVLATITFAVFGQTAGFGFVNYDDDKYVYENPVVAQGLTFKGIVWAFTRTHSANWHPLTWLSHMLDCQLYGLHPGGHHLTNVLLHIAAVIALFLVLRQMTGALWRSAFVAAVFAIHPLRVESVAWVAEHKDVLSGLLFMLTMGAYVRYARRPWSPARYGLVVLLFAMGLMCKPMLVTLPLVLLLLDYWPLQRVEPLKLSGLLLEKLPLLALSSAACVATLLAQNRPMQSNQLYSLPLRCANALVSCMVYLGQMVWPAGLAVFYPFPHDGLPSWEVALAGMLLAGLSAVAWVWRRKQPGMLVGWLWYLVMLLPVVGIIQVGDQAHDDRYTYLPQIGIYVAVTWLAAEWGAKWHAGRLAFGSIMTAVLAVFVVCAWIQTGYWKNSDELWTHALGYTTRNYRAHCNLGNALCDEGRVDEAITHYQEALQIQPNQAEFHNNLGTAFRQEGRVDEAITQYQEALQIQPNEAEMRYNLGNALLQKGRVDEAIADYQKVLQIKPDYAEAHNNLAIALFQKGRVDDAITHYEQALQIQPGFAEGHHNLGLILSRKGRADEAITHFQQALQIKPDYVDAHINLGNALLQKGKVGEAISHFQQALQLKPADPSIQSNLAWLLATSSEASLRNGNRAVELARQANGLTGGENPVVLHTLAAAFAEAGRFPEAVETAQHALRLAGAQSSTVLAGQLQIELKLYQAGSPFHSPEQTH